jgi:hypothetical protein
MLDIVSEHCDSTMFSFFINRILRGWKVRIGEGTNCNRDDARQAVDDIGNSGTARRAEPECAKIATDPHVERANHFDLFV